MLAYITDLLQGQSLCSCSLGVLAPVMDLAHMLQEWCQPNHTWHAGPPPTAPCCCKRSPCHRGDHTAVAWSSHSRIVFADLNHKLFIQERHQWVCVYAGGSPTLFISLASSGSAKSSEDDELGWNQAEALACQAPTPAGAGHPRAVWVCNDGQCTEAVLCAGRWWQCQPHSEYPVALTDSPSCFAL